MTGLEQLASLPKAERLRAMEILWESLAEDDLPSPAWHGEVLAATRQRVAEGKEDPMDWGDAKRLLSSE